MSWWQKKRMSWTRWLPTLKQSTTEVEAKMLLRGVLVVLSFVSLSSISCVDALKDGYLRTVVDNADDKRSQSLISTPTDLYWDYSDGPYGPAHWSELSPSWNVCSSGKSQSPIDIDTGKLTFDQHLDVPAVHDYQDTEAFAVNTGHAVNVLWPAGTLFVEGRLYTLLHFKFHTPSEHTIDGKRFPLEMQLVHGTEDEDYAVVVVLSDYGPTNWWAEEFWHLLPTLDNVGEQIPVGTISPDGFRVDFSKYYQYKGSNTSPDCKENVVWTVLSTVYEISEEQIAHLSSLLPKPNSRPVQPLENRKVYFPQSA